jgi:hypothetical protein
MTLHAQIKNPKRVHNLPYQTMSRLWTDSPAAGNAVFWLDKSHSSSRHACDGPGYNLIYMEDEQK